MKSVTKLIKPFLDVVFPATCVCCGASTEASGTSICNWCRYDRFERAEVTGKEILPAGVHFQFSLWFFDKGGYLQKLLHDLKYNFMMGAGEELGSLAGIEFLKSVDNNILTVLGEQTVMVVPVPLHRKKERERGYNQARAIAAGFSRTTGWKLTEKGVISREKRTKTQTGLSLADRSENLKNAFQINRKAHFHGAYAIIVDDVYTTGATSFEMAKALLEDGATGVAIVTVAKA
ncbi:MAG: ComF family protein [Balneolaceae bacterium]|nr:MAG: ComF family protein [Balneolaceae bacterium]